jgi:hypothetical protein
MRWYLKHRLAIAMTMSAAANCVVIWVLTSR